MRIETQRKIDHFIGVPACFLLTIHDKLFHLRVDPNISRIRKILVILLSEMGSLVLAQPMFNRLARTCKDAEIYALVFEKHKEVLEITRAIPLENIITVDPTSMKSMMKTSLAAIKRMRREGIDAVIDCELFARISAIYSYLSGAKIRVGFHPHNQEGLYRGGFINRPVLYNPYIHISSQFNLMADILSGAEGKPLGKTIVSATDVSRQFVVTIKKNDLLAFHQRLKDDFNEILPERLVLLYPGGGLLPIRAWPVEYFRSVAETLATSGFQVATVGLKGDIQLGSEIIKDISGKSAFNLAGYTKNIFELLCLFQLSRLLITNDGGPSHFAVLADLPCITLFGPETPVLYSPLGKKNINLFKGLSCSPCLTAYNHRNSPCDGDNFCLKAIKPEEVLKHAFALLEKN